MFIVDPRVVQGDATDPATLSERRARIVTSPVYPNGMADDFAAKDPTKRNTYRAAKHRLVATTEPLHPNNMGQYGYRPGRKAPRTRPPTGGSPTRGRLLDGAARVRQRQGLHPGACRARRRPWAGCSSATATGSSNGSRSPRAGNRFGANRHRVDHEVVLVATRHAGGHRGDAA